MAQSVKDLSFALFMGASLDTKYKNVIIADRNKKIVEFFSRPIAQVNKQFFKTKMADKLAPEYRAMIMEINSSKEPYSDSFGRVTYFYIILGTETLPIY